MCERSVTALALLERRRTPRAASWRRLGSSCVSAVTRAHRGCRWRPIPLSPTAATAKYARLLVGNPRACPFCQRNELWLRLNMARHTSIRPRRFTTLRREVRTCPGGGARTRLSSPCQDACCEYTDECGTRMVAYRRTCVNREEDELIDHIVGAVSIRSAAWLRV